MLKSEADLTPDDRFCEIASILAVGILRLKTIPKTTTETPVCGTDGASKKPLESGQNCLDVFPTQRTHVPAS